MPGCSYAFCSAIRNLHKFPQDPDLRAQWIKFCFRQADWVPGPGARICREHFTSKSFFTNPNTLHTMLKKGSVPTIRRRGRAKSQESSAEAACKQAHKPLSDNTSEGVQQQNGEQQPLRTAAPAIDPLQHQPPALCATDVFLDHDYVSIEQQVKKSNFIRNLVKTVNPPNHQQNYCSMITYN